MPRDYFKRLWPLAVLLSVLSGCTSDSLHGNKKDEVPAPTPLQATELCLLYETYSLLTDPMNGPANGPLCRQRLAFTHEALTDRYVSLACRPGSAGYEWGETLLADAQSGRITVDVEAARECITTSLELRNTNPAHSLLKNEAWIALREGPCKSFYTGNVAEGEACVRDWDCDLGSWCTTETPFENATQVCTREHAVGESCSAHIPCAAGLICDNAVCIADPDAGTASIGTSCQTIEDCWGAGPCVGCRKPMAGVPGTCDILGGEGEYCESKLDCVDDLGCTGNLCTSVPGGEDCMLYGESNVQSMCSEGFACADECMQHLSETACVAAGCNYDADWMECTSGSDFGQCIKIPLEMDPCLWSAFCSTAHFCDPVEQICVIGGQEGEACDDTGQTALPCDQALSCVEGVCTSYCLYDEDCDEGSFCDNYQEDTIPTCRPYAPDSCQATYECSEGKYCDNCNVIGQDTDICNTDMDCTWVIDATYCGSPCSGLDAETCTANSRCQYDEAWEECSSVCSTLTTDQCGTQPDACAVGVQSSCATQINCWDFVDEESCNANPICTFANGYCDASCYSMHADPEACNASPACTYQAEWAYCDISCASLHTNQAGCEALPEICAWQEWDVCNDAVDCNSYSTSNAACEAQGDACQWVSQGYCSAATPSVTFTCETRLEIGQQCSIDDMCPVDSFCDYDEDGNTRCMYIAPETDPSCNYTSAGFLRGAFLLGFVFMLRKRKQRKA